jgi:hypothetical protein
MEGKSVVLAVYDVPQNIKLLEACLIPQDKFFHSLSAEQYPTILSLTRFMSVDMNKH